MTRVLSQKHEILCATMLASLVFSYTINTVLLVVFTVLLAIDNFKKFEWGIFKNGFVLICLVYFFSIFISAIFSENQVLGLKFVERNVSFLFIPIVVSSLKIKGSTFNTRKMLGIYVSLITILALIALVVAFYKNHMFNITQDQPFYKMKSWFFTYHYLAQNIKCTAIYLSLYVGFSLILLILDLTRIHTIFPNKRLSIKIIGIVFLSIILLLLSARTIMASTFLVAIILVGVKARRESKIPIFFLSLLITSFIGFQIIKNNDVLRLRVESILTKKEETKYFSGGLNSRVQQWKIIIAEVARDRIIFGFGVGDADQNYRRIYNKKGLKWAVENKFNAHSIYVESFFLMGLIGLISILTLLIFVFKEAIRQNNIAYVSFLFLVVMAGLTESLFNRQYGIVFFVVIASFMQNDIIMTNGSKPENLDIA